MPEADRRGPPIKLQGAIIRGVRLISMGGGLTELKDILEAILCDLFDHLQSS